MKTGKVALLGLVLVWELLFYLGTIHPVRFSHPLGIIEALLNVDFLVKFGATLVYVLIASFFGAIIGMVVAFLASKSSRVTHTSIRFPRLGLWTPFFIFWAVPSRVFPAAVAAVSLFACYQFLSIRLRLFLPWRQAIVEIQRQAILQALLFYLLFQFWSGKGWMSLSFQKVDTACAILVILLFFVFFLERLFQSNFSTTAEMRGTIVVEEIAGTNRSSLWVAGCLIIGCVVTWQLLTDQILRNFRAGSPLAVMEAVYHALASGWLFFDIVVSLLEVFAGLLLAGGVAACIFKNMSNNVAFRETMVGFVPVTFIVPIMIWLVEIHWVGWDVSSLGTALGVALITFYPFIRVLWGLRTYPWVCRTVLAADDALPYAFLAMLFGEAMSASMGLGFTTDVARSALYIDRSLGISLLTFLLLIFLSSFLRTAARRWCPVADKIAATSHLGTSARIEAT